MATVKIPTLIGVIEFEVYPHSTNWNDVGGVYAFAHLEPTGWHVHYVGQTNSFANRIPNHERWPEARRLGATHVLAARYNLQADRDKVEAALIAALRPRLNTQLR